MTDRLKKHALYMDSIAENTRKDEVVRIKSKRYIKNVLLNVLSNIDHTGINLSNVEFMMISCLYQMNANYVFQFLELSLLHEPVAVCITYLVLTSMLGAPMSMLLTFLSSYSKKSFFEFWQCVPLFEGLGYSIGIIRLSIELFNVLHAAFALLLLIRIQDSNLPKYIQSCEYANGTKYEGDCISAQQNKTYSCVDSQPYTAFQVYYRLHITKYSSYEDWKIPAINFPCLWTAIFVWALIFVLVSLGMKRIQRFSIYPHFFFLFVMTALLLSVICFAKRTPIEDTRQYGNPLVKFDFIVILILHTAEVNYMGNTIWIGTMKPESLHPKFAALINPPLKNMMFMSLLGVMSVVAKDNAIHYNLENLDCLSITADDILFVLVPDVLLRYKLWQFVLVLWYGSLFYFLVLPPIYSIIAFLISLEARFPKLIPHRIASCLIICVFGLALTVPLVSETGALIIVIWKYCGLSLLISSLMLLTNLAIFFIYTTDRVINDYTFSFGHPPEKYWTSLWKCSPLFSILAFLFAIAFQSVNIVLATSYNMILIASYVHTALVLTPIIVIAVVKFCTHIQNRKLTDLIQPSPEWGPKDPDLKLARHNYYPKRNIRFRIGKVMCKHKCSVVYHEPYRKEKETQKQEVNTILNHFGSNYLHSP